jgi:iron complex outermembrane recepter protein
MRARQDSINDPSINGKMPENTPNFSGNAGFSYRPTPTGVGFNIGMISFSQRQINPQNQGTIPGVVTVNSGANYNTLIDGRKYTFNLNCTNLLNKRYFSSAIGGAYGVGAPRIISLTSRVDL